VVLLTLVVPGIELLAPAEIAALLLTHLAQRNLLVSCQCAGGRTLHRFWQLEFASFQ
jgi:hypothetical protein